MGYMACGKTTFGRALAKAMGREFIDLDFYIEQRFHTTIKRLFAERGEVAFRQIEASMLREAGEFESVVIACGGGTPCEGDNMDYMLGRGLTVWLRASTPRLVERLLRGGGKRPLVAGKSREELTEFVEGHLESRRRHYERAEIEFASDELESADQISASVAMFLEQFSSLLVKTNSFKE